MNHGFDADTLSRRRSRRDAVAEIHLAGFDATGPCLIDTHGARGRAGRLGALRARDRALRAAADADRVGHRHSRSSPCSKPRPRRPRPCSTTAMPSLAELQRRFADALFARRRRARLRTLVAGPRAPSGWPSIAARSSRTTATRSARPIRSCDASSARRSSPPPSMPTCARIRRAAGDLNDYGGDVRRRSSRRIRPPSELPYLPDVARLEWAIDEANRAADSARRPEACSRRSRPCPGERAAVAAAAARSVAAD